MKQDKIMITTVPVTIRVIEVGGKRMTAAVFNQIQDGFFFDDEIADKKNDMYLGWVAYKGAKYIVFHQNGTLKKDRFERERIDNYLFRLYKDAKYRYENHTPTGWEKLVDPNKLKAQFEDAKEKHEDDVLRVDKWNAMYNEWLTDDKQIFISI